MSLSYSATAEFPRISLSKLSEKGSKRSFDRRFGQYTNAKTARKVPFRCPIRLCCRGVRDFSDSFRRGILGNWVSGVQDSRKLNLCHYSFFEALYRVLGNTYAAGPTLMR